MGKITVTTVRILGLFLLLLSMQAKLIANGKREAKLPEVKIFFQAESPQQSFGMEKLKLEMNLIHEKSPELADILVLTSKVLIDKFNLAEEFTSIKPEGFVIKKLLENKIAIISPDQTGAMYGILDVAEQLQMGKSVTSISEKKINPALKIRGIKFNLPWNSYRTDESLQLHEATVRDLKYWEKFLDMMAENHFNALTLWNLHPFSYMIRAKSFPDACPYNDSELKDWQKFWHGLFKLAADRGIKTYVFNWNIMVSDAFAKKYHLAEYCLDDYPGKNFIGKGDYSPVIQLYTRESIRQLIEEYPELTGIGVSQNERMEGVDEQHWQDWIVDTYFDEIKNAGRNLEFIIRAHTHPAPEMTRKAVEENASKLGTVYVDVKFNWSHGHATPDLMYIHGGSRSKSLWDPLPKNYKMIYTIRNEDFFVLRWGEPDFVRELIHKNTQEFVGGYLIGSETYIPAKEYITKPGKYLTWKYAFEKQWLFYQVWGRLMYNPETKDEIFAHSFNHKYDISFGNKLVEAHKLADKMPLKLASFYASSWDFTLYSEGFLANAPSSLKCLYDGISPFISVNEIIGTVTLDTTLISIKDFVSGKYKNSGKITPLQLAAELRANGEKALKLLGKMETKNPTLIHEIDDIKTWSYLSLYFSEKLKGGTALQQFRTSGDQHKQAESIRHLESALGYWEEVVTLTGKYMDDISLVHLNKKYVDSGNSRPLARFSWANLLGEVKYDIEIAKKGN
ncbi:MAG: hypothetical protein WCP08_03865 [Prolixibacteraceae bacterium]